MYMYIPPELVNISDVHVPTSPALRRFEDIAWVGTDSVASAWDSCEVGCDLPILEHRLCGGTVGLQNFDWNNECCSQGLTLATKKLWNMLCRCGLQSVTLATEQLRNVCAGVAYSP